MRLPGQIGKKLVKFAIIAGWIAIFYLQFHRPFIALAAQNASPNFLLVSIPNFLFFIAWISVPLLVLSVFKNRYFCFKICPVGLLQDLTVSWQKSHPGNFNRFFFLFLLAFSLISINLVGLLDPLVTINRAVVVLIILEHHVILFGLSFLIILILSLILKRFWCWKLCPLGALFDWITIIKKRITRKEKSLDTGRRKALLSIATGLVSGALLRTTRVFAKRDNRLLRPPGSINKDTFSERCIRCGSCIGVCPTGCLRPSLTENGIEQFLTPKLVPRHGACDEFCNKCGQACPSQAIKMLPLEKKKLFKIGTAKIDKSICIGWEHNKLCLICQEYCPYLSIKITNNKNGIPCPEMIPELCRGCGLCEQHCPATPIRAIKIYNDGEGTFIDLKTQEKYLG
ncbi:MAG: 4Fe-4S binding protein [Candidatus Theseobacter exili]|nr:4Fe-4S binding protein [Candidatus Theseobacter exili]